MNRRVSKEETWYLQSLARRVKEISENPKWSEKIKLWVKLNRMEKTRPLVMFPPELWHELIPDDTLKVKDPLFRSIEKELRMRIYRDEYFRDDIVLTDVIYIPYVTQVSDWVDDRKRPYDRRPDHAACFHPCIHEVSDIDKMKLPQLTVDEEKSKENFGLAEEIFGGILTVEEGEPFTAASHQNIMGWGNSLIDIWCELRGLEQVMYDLYEEPAFTHEAMQILYEGRLKYLKEGIAQGIWRMNNNEYLVNGTATACGSNGHAFTDLLPEKEADRKVELKDLWGYCMAQEFTAVSPEMLEEFVLPYQQKLSALFGMNAYGCCEKMDAKYDAVARHIPNLRQVAVSAFSHIDIAAEKIGGRYVMSWKVNPTNVFHTFDIEKIREMISHGMEVSRGNPLIVELREAQTCCGHIERGISWVDICMDLARNYE
ncbi:MAG: hypothetical protein HFH57_11175 [Lachnospiraceae bacterium]|nr:hypothetical protein [Lachnospiraceae bacterium]